MGDHAIIVLGHRIRRPAIQSHVPLSMSSTDEYRQHIELNIRPLLSYVLIVAPEPLPERRTDLIALIGNPQLWEARWMLRTITSRLVSSVWACANPC